MSRGISLRQRIMLRQLLQREEADKVVEPVAWLELDYGSSKRLTDWQNKRQVWNIEQAARRSLRNLEQRGLVKLRRCVFMPYADVKRGFAGLQPYLIWAYTHPNQHIPGQTRIMTGVLLTDRGRRVARDARGAAA
jgi:hypothetical protein